MLMSSIDYNEFVGRIAIGRIERGVIRQNEEIAVCNYHQPDAPCLLYTSRPDPGKTRPSGALSRFS